MVRNLTLIALLFVCFSNCKQIKKEKKGAILSNKKDNLFQACINKLASYDDYKLNVEDYVLKNDEGFFLVKEKLNNNTCLNNFFKNIHTNHSNDFFYNIDDKKMYPLFKKKLEDNIVVGSFVEYYGENDIPGVLLQLNLFDNKGKQIDYLIVFNRFNFEIYFEYEFKIIDDFKKIEIDKKEDDWILFDDKGEIIGERKKPLTNIKKDFFNITKTGFVKTGKLINKNIFTVGSIVYAQVETYLNVRSAPNSNGDIIAKAYPKDDLKVIEVLDDWVKIALNGKEGYVSKDFVR